MAYDIIGNVVDKNNKEIKGVKVTDGVTTTTTNEDGYYEIKTEKTLLSFSLAGFPPKAIDLKTYKNPSSINLDVTLDGASTKNDLDVVLSGSSTTTSKQDDSKGGNKPQVQKEKETNSSKILLYGGAIILLGVLGFLAYKKFKK
jgi:hypothetical protein